MHFSCTFDALLVKSASKVRQEFMTFFLEKIKNDKVLSQKEVACIEFEVKLIQCSLK